MILDMQKKRRELFDAWERVLSDMPLPVQNPLHAVSLPSRPQFEPLADLPKLTGKELMDELAAWSQASDEDFENFEKSLE